MRNRRSILLVVAGILLVLAAMVFVAISNGGDTGGSNETPTLTPSPSSSP